MLIAAGGAAYFFYDDLFTKYKTVPYSVFYRTLESGNIDKVEIKSDSIIFHDSVTQITFKTKRPDSPELEENIMRFVDDVSVEKDSAEVLSLIFDSLFYIFFFGVIIVVFRKFISPNTFKVIHKTGVKFDDVVGMDNLKRDMGAGAAAAFAGAFVSAFGAGF